MIKFYTLLFIGFLSQMAFAQIIPQSTIREIYNFDVGDTFEYKIFITSLDNQPGCDIQSYELLSVLSKQFTDNSISYNIKWDSFSWFNPNNLQCRYPNMSESYIGSLIITQLDSTIFWYHTYQSFGCDSHDYCYSDTVYIDSSMNNIKVNAHMEGSPAVFGADTAYADGIGLVWEGFGDEDNTEQQGNRYLIYYHKASGETWGTLANFVVASIEDIVDEFSITVSPNPATSSFHLQLSETPSQPSYFQLYDALGRQVKQEKITEANSILERNNLSNGIYFWQLESEGKVISRGKLVFE